MAGILNKASHIIYESKKDYGTIEENFSNLAQIASILTGKDLTPEDCCKVLIALKLARESHKHKEDNLIDLCGYAEILNQIIDLSENKNEKL